VVIHRAIRADLTRLAGLGDLEAAQNDLWFQLPWLARHARDGAESTVNLIFAVAECLIGLVAVALLWQRGSHGYFAFFRRPR
jgi:hypothetical protein